MSIQAFSGEFLFFFLLDLKHFDCPQGHYTQF